MLLFPFFDSKLSFFICHLSFSAAHVIPSLISLHGAPCIIITLCPAGKLRFTVYRNYGCWNSVLASSLPASHWYFLHFFRKTFGGFTLIYLFCNCSLAEVSLSGGIEGGNLYIEKAYLRFVLDVQESGSSPNVCQTLKQQSRPCKVYIHGTISTAIIGSLLYSHLYTNAWASALSRFDIQAMPEPLNVGRATRELPTLFVCIWTLSLNLPSLGVVRH